MEQRQSEFYGGFSLFGAGLVVDGKCPKRNKTPDLELQIDVLEDNILSYSPDLLKLLLADRTTGKNIVWATNDYIKYGKSGYDFHSEIKAQLITGEKQKLIQPRITKSKKNQAERTKDKAEVFTPSWICNKQNNLIDEEWFGNKDVFNTETVDKHWQTNSAKVKFSNKSGRSWQDYVNAIRLEIACGEAPYLVSRYDTVSGDFIDVQNRIGLLDRKLRVVNENTDSFEDWYRWVKKAFQSIYGYEFQGDNLLLARENLLCTFVDNLKYKFNKGATKKQLEEIAKIISWNIWQMDGIRGVIPCSCCASEIVDLFGDKLSNCCIGCKTGNIHAHNGTYCKIMDWEKKKEILYISMLKDK